MSVTIPSLDPVTDILDTDKIMVTQSSGQTYTIDGASFNKRNQAVIASSTTLTGAPLKTSNIVRAYFTADITGVNTTTGLVLNYNGSNKDVKVPKDGALANFTAQNMGGSPTVYKYLQAYTTLELLYDGTNFVIIGNPVVISSANYAIYADGKMLKNISFNNYKNKTNSEEIQTSQWKTLQSYEITQAGNYIITGSLYFSSNNNGIRICMITLSENDNTNDCDNSVLCSGRSDIQRINTYSFNGGETVYLKAYQSSGSTLNVKSQINILRLLD